METHSRRFFIGFDVCDRWVFEVGTGACWPAPGAGVEAPVATGAVAAAAVEVALGARTCGLAAGPAERDTSPPWVQAETHSNRVVSRAVPRRKIGVKQRWGVAFESSKRCAEEGGGMRIGASWMHNEPPLRGAAWWLMGLVAEVGVCPRSPPCLER